MGVTTGWKNSGGISQFCPKSLDVRSLRRDRKRYPVLTNRGYPKVPSAKSAILIWAPVALIKVVGSCGWWVRAVQGAREKASYAGWAGWHFAWFAAVSLFHGGGDGGGHHDRGDPW